MSLKDLQKQENKPQSNLKATLVVPPNRIKQDESFDDDDDVKSGSNLPTYPRPKTSTAPNVNSGKELTPKERMLLNKLKKADEEAAKVGSVNFHLSVSDPSNFIICVNLKKTNCKRKLRRKNDERLIPTRSDNTCNGKLNNFYRTNY